MSTTSSVEVTTIESSLPIHVSIMSQRTAVTGAMISPVQELTEMVAHTSLSTTPSVSDPASRDSSSGTTAPSTVPSVESDESAKPVFVEGKVVCGWPFPSRTAKLAAFNKTISRFAHNRFMDLRRIHAADLNKCTGSSPRPQGILMTLKSLGQNETDAEPFVHLQCDKSVARKVRAFFKRADVISEYQPQNPDTYSPHFGIFVCPLPPRPLWSSASKVQIGTLPFIELPFGDPGHDRTKLRTLSGVALSPNNKHNTYATNGGIVMIENTSRHIDVYAMTTGHLFRQNPDDNQIAENDSVYDDDSDAEDDLQFVEPSTEKSTQLDMMATEHEEIIYMFSDAFEETREHKNESSMILSSTLWTPNKGDVYEGQNFDWALLPINNDLCLPNFVCPYPTDVLSSALPITLNSKDDEKTDPHNEAEAPVGRHVCLIAAVSGYRTGILQVMSSYMMLSPGSQMIQVLELFFENGYVLKPGDSGAWTVDVETGELLGHVIASDVFGSAYMVPIQDTFQDMKTRLPEASRVYLPTLLDIMSLNRSLVAQEESLIEAGDQFSVNHTNTGSFTQQIPDVSQQDVGSGIELSLKLAPHDIQSKFLELIARLQGDPEQLSLLDEILELAKQCQEQGLFEDAEKILKRAVEGFEKALGPEHSSTNAIYIELAILHRDQGRLDDEEKMWLRALQGLEKTHNPDETSTFCAFTNLGLLYTEQGKFEDAVHLYQRALQKFENSLGREHELFLNTATCLGIAFQKQGMLDAAESNYLLALEGFEKALGSDPTFKLCTLMSLAQLYTDQGKLDDATKIYERALQTYAQLYTDQGKLEDAKEIYERGLQTYENFKLQDRISILTIANNIGIAYQEQGKLDEARKLFRQALEDVEEALGPDDPLALLIACNLGLLYADEGEFDEAEKIYQRLVIHTKLYGVKDPQARYLRRMSALAVKLGHKSMAALEQ